MAYVAGAFIAAFLAGLLIYEQPAAVGCAMPVLVIVAFILFALAGPRQHSTAAVGIPFVAMLVFLGSCPGALVGSLTRRHMSKVTGDRRRR